MRDATKRAAVLTALGLAACGKADPPPDFFVRGVGVAISSDAPFVHRADLPARIESTIDAALGYWGGTWRGLTGVTITLDGDRYVQCGGKPGAVGCFDGNIRVSTQDQGFIYYCVEETVLVHEIGHAVIGDPGHLDPRWMDFTALAQELAGQTGYTPDGEVPCQLWTSIWQHPPDR